MRPTFIIFFNEKKMVSGFSDLASPVIQTMAGEVIVSENQLVVIPCLAIGNPKVAVNWWKRGKGGFPPLPLPTTAYDDFRFDETPNKIRVKEGILLIPSAKRIHSGSYICNATNSIGSETREVAIISFLSFIPLQWLRIRMDFVVAGDVDCADVSWASSQSSNPDSFTGENC